MKFKGAIFDLDGVICFTDELHYQAWKLLADRLEIYFDKEINNRLRGVSRMESLDIILERATVPYSQEEKNAFAAEKNENYVKSLSSMTEKDVDETVVNSLKALRSFGVKLSVGSSSKNAKTILGRLGITDLFDAVSDGTNITKSKPDPEVFLKAAEFLGLKPEECLVVEDAKAGIDAAKAGGFTAVGIGEAAEYEKTDYPIQSLKDLLAIV